MKRSHSTIVVLMVMILLVWPGLQSVVAASDSGDRLVKLSTTARFSPIGMMAGRATVDGRAFEGYAPIWGGEVIQAAANDSLSVSLDGVGQITLGKRAVARISTATGNTEEAGRNILVASLLDGSLSARLVADAGAYVEAAGSTWAAAPGAQFRVQVAEGHAALDNIVGHITIEQQPVAAGQRYILRPPAGQGSSLSVSARSTRQLQIQVTDENDHPVPDLPILFSLANPCLGTLGAGLGAGTVFKGKTDKRGIASVPWITGAAKCADTILVRVEGTDNTFTYRAQVSGSNSFWTPRNTAIVAGLAAGAGIGIGVAVNNSGSNTPITPVPPPQIKP
jgi:uncharacterized protein YaiE (UPF0345 family)